MIGLLEGGTCEVGQQACRDCTSRLEYKYSLSLWTDYFKPLHLLTDRASPALQCPHDSAVQQYPVPQYQTGLILFQLDSPTCFQSTDLKHAATQLKAFVSQQRDAAAHQLLSATMPTHELQPRSPATAKPANNNLPTGTARKRCLE
jgi:hypothetical protein